MISIETAIKNLKNYSGKELRVMEVCGTHTSVIHKSGIRSILPDKIKLISGPGCPVCVTPPSYIDKLIYYSKKENHAILSFGDMLKVSGSSKNLSDIKAEGGDVKMILSPLDAVSHAVKNPKTIFILAAVGFETTTPGYALLLDEIIEKNIKNIKLLTAIKTMPPVLDFICNTENNIDAFIAPGNVSVITGCQIYRELSEKYNKSFVIAGFSGEHIIAAINKIILSENGVYNLYPSAVSEKGNEKAKKAVEKYFTKNDGYWRGIGKIKNSALILKDEYTIYDAGSHIHEPETALCRCSDVILGRMTPAECRLFGNKCTPAKPQGPCMVSTEGACGIWINN